MLSTIPAQRGRLAAGDGLDADNAPSAQAIIDVIGAVRDGRPVH
jgi:hypothetical protein